MSDSLLLNIFFGIYLFLSILLVTYGLNCYWLLYLFLTNRKKRTAQDQQYLGDFYKTHKKSSLPKVTTQIPIFNESNVVERVLKAVCELEYPKGKHDIQVLDDSTDECKEISKKLVKELKDQGHSITFIHRTDRKDYKAGALKEGLKTCKGDIVVIFDADFVPTKDFLLKSVPFFYEDERIAFVQARWGHLNANKSLFTLAQSIAIDGHFIIEQSARYWGNLHLNFNGTAGLWKKEAIIDAGNWEGDTLTEDMDLSYRVQLKGWKSKFLFDLIVPAEIPPNLNSFKVQQYRWAKGSIQTAMKLLPRVLASNTSWKVKLQSFLHMTHYFIHPLILVTALSSAPLLVYYPLNISEFHSTLIVVFLSICAFAPSAMYITSQRTMFQKQFKNRLKIIPVIMAVGIGIALNNTVAVFSALSKRKGAFVRTPKEGDCNKKKYKPKISFYFWFELFMAFYCFTSFGIYLQAEKYAISPFLIIYGISFLVVVILSVRHQLQSNKN